MTQVPAGTFQDARCTARLTGIHADLPENRERRENIEALGSPLTARVDAPG